MKKLQTGFSLVTVRIYLYGHGMLELLSNKIFPRDPIPTRPSNQGKIYFLFFFPLPECCSRRPLTALRDIDFSRRTTKRNRQPEIGDFGNLATEQLSSRNQPIANYFPREIPAARRKPGVFSPDLKL